MRRVIDVSSIRFARKPCLGGFQFRIGGYTVPLTGELKIGETSEPGARQASGNCFVHLWEDHQPSPSAGALWTRLSALTSIRETVYVLRTNFSSRYWPPSTASKTALCHRSCARRNRLSGARICRYCSVKIVCLTCRQSAAS